MRRFQKFLNRHREKPQASNSSSWLERNKSALELFAVWTESIGVLVAAIFAIQQYADNSTAEQVNKTLSYIDRFHADAVSDAREKFEKVFDDRKNEIFKISTQPDAEVQFARYLERIMDEQDLDVLLNKILEFFDELNICAEANLCDEKTAIRFFGKYAWDFSGLMKPYIWHLREEYHDPTIGLGMLRIAHRFRLLQKENSSTHDGPMNENKKPSK
ncbi:MAG: hypothetical protein RLZ25_905 [Pseudomonadota bacterium]|jgi:hypothetical protein